MKKKWRKRTGKVAPPVLTAGAVAGTMVLTGGQDVLEAVPESVAGVTNIVKETGSLLTTGLKTSNFLLENLYTIGIVADIGYAAYKFS